MNSTGQNLGVNPLMGTTETAINSDVAKSVSALPADDKPLKNKGFSDYMEGQKEAEGPVVTSSAEESIEEVAVVEGATTGSVINTAPPTPETMFAANGGSALPMEGSSLPLGQGTTTAAVAIEGQAGGNATNPPVTSVTTTQITATSEGDKIEAANTESTNKAQSKVPLEPALNARTDATSPAVAAAPLTAANKNGTKDNTTPVINSAKGGTRPVATTPTSQSPVTPTTPVTTPVTAAATEVAVAESTTASKPAATLFSLQESPLGLRVKPQMANNPSGIATIENPFVEPKEASALTAATPLTATEAPQAYRSYSETGLQTAISVPVGKPGWSETVMQRVMWMSSQNISKAEIALDPPELGPMNVKISSSGDQTSVVFTSSHGAVRDALDQGLHRLREMMESQGVNLSDVDVSDQSASQERQQAEAGSGAEGELADEGVEQEGVVVSKPLSLVDQYV